MGITYKDALLLSYTYRESFLRGESIVLISDLEEMREGGKKFKKKKHESPEDLCLVAFLPKIDLELVDISYSDIFTDADSGKTIRVFFYYLSRDDLLCEKPVTLITITGCTTCDETGAYSGYAEPIGTAVVCRVCGGRG